MPAVRRSCSWLSLGLVLGPLGLCAQQVAVAGAAELPEPVVLDQASGTVVPDVSASIGALTLPRAWFGSAPWGRWDRATGDWAGTRSLLEGHGITVEGSWIYDVSSNVRGGVARGTRGRGLFTAAATVDLGTVAGLAGGTFAISYMTMSGPAGGELTGDAQTFSNIDIEPTSRRYDLWYEQRLLGDRVRAKVGYVDANSEFAVVTAAGEFLNSSAGFSPTLYGLPTYPDPALSATLFVSPAGWLTLGGAVYRGTLPASRAADAAADAPFGIVELVASPAALGRAGVGVWHHAGYAPRLDGGLQQGPTGWYAFLERRLSGTEGDDSTAARGLSGFVRYGWADARVNDFARHYMAGVVLDAPLGWAGNALGAGVSHVDLSDRAGYAHDETAIEGFLRVQVLGFLTLRPDLQYIVHPGGAAGVDAALVSTLRVETAF